MPKAKSRIEKMSWFYEHSGNSAELSQAWPSWYAQAQTGYRAGN